MSMDLNTYNKNKNKNINVQYMINLKSPIDSKV